LSLTWGPTVLSFFKRHPWQVFAAVLVAVLLLDLMLNGRRSRGDGGDIGIFDGGDGGSDGGGD
jgi:hypothetical protein